MKKLIALLLLASMLVLALASCGGDTDTPGGTPGEVVNGKFDGWRGEDETSKNNGDGSYEAGSYEDSNSDDWTDNY